MRFIPKLLLISTLLLFPLCSAAQVAMSSGIQVGGTVLSPTVYTCLNTAADTARINTLLAPGNVSLDLNGSTCDITSHVIMVGADILKNGVLNSNYSSADFVIVNNAYLNPSTTSLTASLSSGSNTITASSAIFTPALQFQSLTCNGAWYNSYPLNVTIMGIGGATFPSTTATMSAPSQETNGSVSCTITQRDTPTLRDLTINVTATGSGPSQQPVVFMEHVNNFLADNVKINKAGVSGAVNYQSYWGISVTDYTHAIVQNGTIVDTYAPVTYGSDGVTFFGPGQDAQVLNEFVSVNDNGVAAYSSADTATFGGTWPFQAIGQMDGVTVDGLSGSGQYALGLGESCYDTNCTAAAPINHVVITHTNSQPTQTWPGSTYACPADQSCGFSIGMELNTVNLPGQGYSDITEADPAGEFNFYEVNVIPRGVGTPTTNATIDQLKIIHPWSVTARGGSVIQTSGNSSYPTVITNMVIDAPYYKSPSPASTYLVQTDAHTQITNLISNDARTSDYSFGVQPTNFYSTGPTGVHANGDVSGDVLGAIGTASVSAANGGNALAAFTPTTNGTAGSTSYSFELVCTTGNGVATSPVETLTTGNATVTSTNSINIPTGSAIAGCPSLTVYLTSTVGSFTKGVLCGTSVFQPLCPASGGTFVWAGVHGDGSTAPTASNNTTGYFTVVGAGANSSYTCDRLEQTAGTVNGELCYTTSNGGVFGAFQPNQLLMYAPAATNGIYIDPGTTTTPLVLGSSGGFEVSMDTGTELTGEAPNNLTTYIGEYDNLAVQNIVGGYNGNSSSPAGVTATLGVYGGYGIGSNIAGYSLTLGGGKSTGTGAGGPINFATSPAGSSGSSLNSRVQAAIIDSTKAFGVGSNTSAASSDPFFVTSSGATTALDMILTGATPTVSSGQIGFGVTTVAASNCGSLAGAAGCIVVNISGTAHYVPYW